VVKGKDNQVDLNPKIKIF
jgi:hypothetical protein